MRLLLILLVLLYITTIVYGNLSNCKLLCSDKKSCCSSPLNNEYYLKTMECNKPSCGVKGVECSKLKNFAGSKYFGCGSVVTICSVGDISTINGNGGKHVVVDVDEDDDVNEYEEKVFLELLGESTASALSASSAYATAMADIGLAESTASGQAASDMSSLMSSMSSGDGDGNYDDDDDGAAAMNRHRGVRGGKGSYKGGNGKFRKEFGESTASALSASSAYATATADVGLAVSSVTGELSSDMSSVLSSLSSGGDGGDDDFDDDGALSKVKAYGKQLYKGGNGKKLKKHAKCIKVLTIDSETDYKFDDNEKVDKPIVGVSKLICKKLFGSESSCDSIENQKSITVVQSTKNDGFPNKSAFFVTHEEYNIIIKHGKILRNQCEIKGKCQFNRA